MTPGINGWPSCGVATPSSITTTELSARDLATALIAPSTRRARSPVFAPWQA